MIRRSWLALAAAVAVAAVFPTTALAARDTHVTKGLDYLHAQQVAATGGFVGPAQTIWAVMGAVAAQERMGSSAWTHGRKNPMTSLQALNLKGAGTSTLNAPVFYAQAILAYMAGYPTLTRELRVGQAGTPATDLYADLAAFQDTTAGSATFGAYSPISTSRDTQAVRTTCWAILAAHALGHDVGDAAAWLRKQQNTDGGFGPNVKGSKSDTVDTALATQALRAAGVTTESDPLVFLHAVQLKKSGGFPAEAGGSMDTDATAYCVQAIYAVGQDPVSSAWRTPNGKTPRSALKDKQLKSGAYLARTNTLSSPVTVTGHVLVALQKQPFSRFPRAKPGAVKAFVYRPHFTKVLPKGGSTFKTTQIVLIRATYGDGKGGTGINAKAVRLSVDNSDKTKAAVVGDYGLHLTLKNVPNGKHTYKIVIKDRAGNDRQVEHSFTVAVPISPTTTPTFNPTPVPTQTSTFPPPTYHPTPTPTATPTPTPTQSTTLYPTPTTSGSPYATPTPTTSGTPIGGVPVNSPSPGAGAGGSAGGGGGSAAGFLGGTLLAMLPLGAALTYYLLRRREDAMAGAVVGEHLAGGGSGWEKARSAFGKSKDIVKPARS